MSDRTEQATSGAPSLLKRSAPRGPREDIAKVPPPRTIELAGAAIGVVLLGLAGRALGLLGSTPTLEKYLTHLNDTAKKPIKNYNVEGALHTLRVGALIQSAVVIVALVMLVFALRRPRSAGGSRWALLIIVVLTSLPFYVIPISGWPLIPQVSSVIAGVASIAALVLVFLPASRLYFHQCRDAVTPPELRGQSRPGLAGLFGSRRARTGGVGAARGEPATSRPARPAHNSSSSAKARAKVRHDADAVARGAELARSRAKASKSRRTDG